MYVLLQNLNCFMQALRSQEDEQIKKPVRRTTKSTIQGLIQQKQQQNESIQVPDNGQSEEAEEGGSNEARYLSNLYDDNNSESQVKSFWTILYRCVIYMKKQNLVTKIDDILLAQELRDHIDMRIHPEYTDAIGKQMLENGYVLAAYSILMARLYASPFLARYLFDYFQRNHTFMANLQQFTFYSTNNRIFTLIPLENQIFNFEKVGIKRLMPIDDIIEDFHKPEKAM